MTDAPSSTIPSVDMVARAWHAWSDEPIDAVAFDGEGCNCRNFAPDARRVIELFYIVTENTPEGLHKIVPGFVHTVDSIVVDVAYPGWAKNEKGDRTVKREIRSSLKKYGLPVTGDLFDRVYAYVRENY